jgi:hypothetical protein
MRHPLPRHRGENVTAPVLIISKADAKHVPTTASIGRVADEIGRPSQPDVRALGISDQDETWLVLRLPRKMALCPANDRRADSAVVALVNATLIQASRRRNRFVGMRLKRKRKPEGACNEGRNTYRSCSVHGSVLHADQCGLYPRHRTAYKERMRHACEVLTAMLCTPSPVWTKLESARW